MKIKDASSCNVYDVHQTDPLQLLMLNANMANTAVYPPHFKVRGTGYLVSVVQHMSIPLMPQ